MKISKTTLDILKNFSNINPEIYILAGKELRTKTKNSTIFAFAKIEDEFESPVIIYNLSQFLGVLTNNSGSELLLSEDSLTISSGKSKIKYMFGDKDIIVPVKKIKGPDVYDVEFELSEEDLTKILSTASLLSLDVLSFVGNSSDNTVQCFVHNKELKNGSSQRIELDTIGNVSDFSFDFDLEKIKIMKGSYQVRLSKKKISEWTNKNMDLKYYISINDTSEVGQ